MAKSLLGNTQAKIAKRNEDELRQLPRRGETWQYSETELSWQLFRRLAAEDMISKEGEGARDSGAIWTISRNTQDWLDRRSDND